MGKEITPIKHDPADPNEELKEALVIVIAISLFVCLVVIGFYVGLIVLISNL